MEYTIENEYLTAVISSKGAELIKLIDKDGINRMHTPNKDTWNRVSPILFPQISRMPNFEYSVDGVMYNMTMHGFVRDSELDLVSHNKTNITLKLSHNQETIRMYPYEFNLYITYNLLANNLDISFKVENLNNKVLRYMLGGHPGFKVPLFDDESFSDYSIIFEKKETKKRMCVVDGFLANVYQDYLCDTNTINLRRDLFTVDTLVFKNLKSNFVDVISKNHNKKIRVHFSEFETLAIWSKIEENANFVCIEPWNGIQKEFVKEHEEMGVLEIKPFESSYHSYRIEII